MSAIVTRTKILCPNQRTGLISRPRLLGMLDDILDFPFTLISAPAGYGKTSLLIDLVQQSNFPICWFSLDKFDVEPRRFLDHFIASIQLHFPDFGRSVSSLLDNHPNPLKDTAQTVSTLVNDLYQHVNEHILIVLDDFHLIENSSEIKRFINDLGHKMDENIHIVITSRNQIDLPDISLFIGRRMIKGIGFQDLAFDKKEIKSFFNKVLGQKLSDDDALQLANDSEGWITGLLLSGKHKKGKAPSQYKAAQVSGGNIFNYLAEEVFHVQPKDIKKFLLYSSLFDEFDHKLYYEIFSWPRKKDWQQFINLLIQQNLFIQLVGEKPIWVRYHKLFLEFLQDRFVETYPRQSADFQKKLLDVYAQRLEWENAYETALRIKDDNLTAQLVDQASSYLFYGDRINLLKTWLNNLSMEIINTKPSLEIMAGICETSLGNPQVGLRLLSKSITNPNVVDQPILLARALLCRATTSRLLGNYHDARDDIIDIQRLDTENLSRTIIAEVHREAGLINSFLDDIDLSLDFLTQSLQIYIDNSDYSNSSIVHTDIGMIYYDVGQYEQAEYHFHQARDICLTLNNKSQYCIVLNNLGNLALHQGKYSIANEYFCTGMELAKELANARMLAYFYASFADLDLAIQSYKESKTKYESALEISKSIQEGFLISYVEIQLMKLERSMSSDMSKVSSLIDPIEKRITLNSYLINGLFNTEAGFQLLNSGQLEESKNSFLSAKEQLSRLRKPLEMAIVDFGLSLFEHASGNLINASKYLISTVNILSSTSNYHPILPDLSKYSQNVIKIIDYTLNSDLKKLKNDLIEHQKSIPKIQKSISQFRSTQQSGSHQIKIQAFGTVKAWIGDKRISIPEWIHQKTVRDLLIYLLCHPEGVSRDDIGLVFWADSSPKKLAYQFKNAIYRLRRAVGKDMILYDTQTHCYQINPMKDFYYDVFHFLDLIKDADQENQEVEKIKILGEAVGLYQHPFSADVDGVWAEAYRRDLYLAYENAALYVARDKLENNDPIFCIGICNDLLAIDPYQERAHQLIMLAYARDEDLVNAQRQYQLCKNNLRNDLDIDVSNTTLSIYKTIFSKEAKYE